MHMDMYDYWIACECIDGVDSVQSYENEIGWFQMDQYLWFWLQTFRMQMRWGMGQTTKYVLLRHASQWPVSPVTSDEDSTKSGQGQVGVWGQLISQGQHRS